MNLTKWSKRLKFLVAFLLPLAMVMTLNNGLDNDSWYVLAEGREVVENGIYYEDQLSMHEGLSVTVQNYGFAAIFYLVFSVFGGVGIYIAMLLLNVVLCYLIYKVCMLLSNKNENLSLILMMITDILLATTGFVVTRAQMVSYVILMLVIYILELYAREGRKKTLWWIPVLSLLQINLHASVWPMILIVMVVYTLDAAKQPRLHYKGYKLKPLLITFAVSFLVGFLNPYGFKMMTFILNSYGISEANAFVRELGSFTVFANWAYILLYAAIVVVMILYIFGKNKNIRLRYLFMMFGFLMLGLNTVKGMSHLILVLFFPMAEVYKGVKIVKWRGLGRVVMMWMGMLSITTMIACLAVTIPSVNNAVPDEVVVKGVDAMDSVVGETSKNNLKVYADYNMGGYVEYRGYRPYIDPRMEVFIKSNNGKEELFKEFYDLQCGKLERTEFLEKYDFDYLVLNEWDVLYNFDYGNEYDLLFEEDEENNEADGVKVYKKKRKVI